MKFYQVSSFTDNVFGGNPAGVCLLNGEWLSDELMQSIAAQINLSETVFVLDKGGELYIRWFTPTVEVDLCGHATLAAAHVLYEYSQTSLCETDSSDSQESTWLASCGGLVFKSGLYTLPVNYEDGMLVLDFPMAKIRKLKADEVPLCFNFAPKEFWTGNDEYLLVFENQSQVECAVCDLEKAALIDLSGFIITAKAETPGLDFVSRYFGPKIGINEDPVTGSAHTLLVPYWQKIMGKDKFHAAQLSKRGGQLFCRADGDRVKISGKAVTFLTGEIIL